MIGRDWLRERAARSPSDAALTFEGEELSWSALDEQTDQHASALLAAGVRSGDRVALLAENGPDFAAWTHAVGRVGAVLVPLNWRLTAPELRFQLDHAGVRILVHDATHAALAESAAGRLPRLPCSARGQRPPGAQRLEPEALLALVFTSGTTGRPKAAMLSRRAFFWSAVGSAFHLGVLPQERWLACMPLFHVGGLSILTRSVLYGTAACLHARFDAGAASRALDEDGITLASFTATMLQRLLREREGRPAPTSLRAVLLGGGPCPRPLLDEATAAGFPIAPTYGLTEACSQVATRRPGAPPDAGLTPLPGTEVRVSDETGARLAPGRVGEIWVRGPTLADGYWNDPAESASAISEGWLRTGDLGCLDECGGLHIRDRRSDLIVSGGENVYPAEVEAALLAHPGVGEVAVAAVDDPEFGQRPAAWWVVAESAAPAPDASALRAFCRERLAGYKVPVAFERVEALPRDGAGKLLRRRLAPAPRS